MSIDRGFEHTESFSDWSSSVAFTKPLHFLLHLCHLQTVFWQKTLCKSYFVHFLAEADPGSRQCCHLPTLSWAGAGCRMELGHRQWPQGGWGMLLAAYLLPSTSQQEEPSHAEEWEAGTDRTGQNLSSWAQLPSAPVFLCWPGQGLLGWPGHRAVTQCWPSEELMPLVWGEGTEPSPPPSQHGVTSSSGRAWEMLWPCVQLGALTGHAGRCEMGTALQAPRWGLFSTQMSMESTSVMLCRELPLKPAPAVRGKSYRNISTLLFPGSHHFSLRDLCIPAVPSVCSDLGLGMSSHRLLILLNMKTG